VLFLLFFVSGAAALVYEVVWVRSLGLVFGASHLAVTTVLAVYMAGQAIGSSLFGSRADRTERPLRLYGLLEIGIGLSGLAFLGLMKVYPVLYAPLARVAEENRLYLTVVRTAFAVLAMIVPTSLMGGTLPTLSRFVSGRSGGPARQLSFLYAANTLGAVAGTLVTGFFLLQTLGVTATMLLASGLSTVVGVTSILLQRRSRTSDRVGAPVTRRQGPQDPRPVSDLAVQLTLLGVGLSGFCALGYEVLWTRMLTFVVGTSVYSFTIMLGAFLAGIALGSHSFGVLSRRWKGRARGLVLLFAATQVAIGLSALMVTLLMRHLPSTADRVQVALAALRSSVFGGRVASSFSLAFAYLLVPAFFMGMAFPVAGAVYSLGRERIGSAIGRLLTANTVGAILGSAVSGYALIYLFGIERSLQMLVIVNVATGCVVATSIGGRRWSVVAITSCAVLFLVARGASPGWGRVWDQKLFAIYTSSGRSFDTPERVQEHLQDTEVLYYHEGVNETVSVVRPRGDVHKTFIVNGRPEASTAPVDVQLQRTLGHLPVLLHPDPRSVFVLGTGTGMTLGSTLVHPEVQRVTLGEIEEGVLGVARLFSDWNDHALDSPKLRIVFNDGRNFLASTREKFDVITADPIHPWSGGAAYLYTAEYFRTVAAALAPRGIAAQWLPLYELSTRDVRTVVRTFSEVFPHVMVWLTYYDAVLVGSKEPILLDENDLARRMNRADLRSALAPIQMASARDFLSYFVMGDAGARTFAQGGEINTDDNLFLEFSAPRSQGVSTDGANVAAIGAQRESIVPYLKVERVSEDQRSFWTASWAHSDGTGRLFDPVHARYLLGDRSSGQFQAAAASVHSRDPAYAPLRFLLDEKAFSDRTEPVLVSYAEFESRNADGRPDRVRISAVRQFVGRGRVLVSFVDNARKVIYGQRYICGDYEHLEESSRAYIDVTMAQLRGSIGSSPRTTDQLADLLRREVAQAVAQSPEPSRRSSLGGEAKRF
jgi:spermidine synthase